jgi:hypothetical protein
MQSWNGTKKIENKVENKIGDFIIKQLNEKKVQRWVISSDDLFILCSNMAIIDDNEIMISIVDYLDENEIDVNFHGTHAREFYGRWNELEKMIKLRSILNGSKTETQLMMEKVDSISVPERPNWLQSYMDDEEEPNSNPVVNEDVTNQLQRIGDMLRKELEDRVNSEPTPTIEELQQQIDGENNTGDIIGEGF